MSLKTVDDYQKEIARVRAAITKTNSKSLKRDYGKYMKRLQREVKIYNQYKGVRSGSNEADRANS